MIWKALFLTMTLFHASRASELGVLDRYTTMRTIAGSGSLKEGDDGENVNFWEDRFEGMPPLNVELSNPHDCGTDAYGRVYIVDKESHSVLRVSADGSKITTVAGTHSPGDAGDAPIAATSGALQNPNGLFVFPDGGFLILDTDNRKVRFVSPEGIMSTRFTYPAGFGAGRGLVASPLRDEIYFCGEFLSGTKQQVKRWSAVDGFVTIAGINPGSRGLGNLDLGPNDDLYVTSAGDHRVFRIPKGGPPEIVAGNGAANGNLTSGSLATTVSLDRVRGIAVLHDGSFFVATQKGGDVWWVDNGAANDGVDRRIHLFVNGADSGNIKFGDDQPRVGAADRIAEPRAIHLATNGDLLITCNDTGVIRAVRNACRPQAPVLKLSFGVLTWDANWGERFMLETSETLEESSWAPMAGITSRSNGTQQLVFSNPAPRFMRFFVSHLAGGQ